MTAPLILDHAWRPSAWAGNRPALDDRPCEYMNCRWPIGEHARAVTGRRLPR